mmetsp:Transcript_55465/g.154602  ORF Transcript_55465/g.154602 Transcript_55465/m.154602 type:complete len:215 (+) Transcript_55465:1676-2320(+)
MVYPISGLPMSAGGKQPPYKRRGEYWSQIDLVASRSTAAAIRQRAPGTKEVMVAVVAARVSAAAAIRAGTALAGLWAAYTGCSCPVLWKPNGHADVLTGGNGSSSGEAERTTCNRRLSLAGVGTNTMGGLAAKPTCKPATTRAKAQTAGASLRLVHAVIRGVFDELVQNCVAAVLPSTVAPPRHMFAHWSARPRCCTRRMKVYAARSARRHLPL